MTVQAKMQATRVTFVGLRLAAASRKVCLQPQSGRVVGAPSRPALRSLSSAATAEEETGQKRILDRLVHSGLIGLTLYCAYELGQVVFDWPEPCQQLVDKAKASNDVLVIFGGKVSGSFFWEGKVDQTTGRASVRIPVSGPSGRQGTLFGQAVRDKDGKWVLLNCELHILKRDPNAVTVQPVAVEPSRSTPASASGGAATRAGPGAHPYDEDVEAVFDLLGKGRLGRQDIDVYSWKEGSPGAPKAPAAAK